MPNHYKFVIVDRIFCECYIKWTYEDSSDTAGRAGLYKLHEKSANDILRTLKCAVSMM